jgi:signal transduction histidine kinase
MIASPEQSVGTMSGDLSAVHERRFRRERLAKEQAEKLLESKSLELYLARQQAEADRKLLLDAIGAMRDGFAILDDEMCVLIRNSAFDRLFGEEAGDGILGCSLPALLERLQIEKMLDEEGGELDPDRLELADRDRLINCEIGCRDGRVLRLSIEPDCSSGRPVIIRDDTARRKLERDLEAARKHEAIGTMAGGIAHEINTPSQYITSNLEFIENIIEESMPGAAGDENVAALWNEVADAVRDSLDGARQIARIVAAIRLYSHPGSGNREPTDIGRLLQSITVITRNQWHPVAMLSLDMPEDLGEIGIYQDSMKQVFLNLLVNAAQAIEDVGARPDGTMHRIAISASRNDGEVAISIEDSGPGIPLEMRDKIYDMFFTTKAPGEGTGQGLAISRRIVIDEHGGALECGESALGGAKFVVRLPVC